MIRTKGIFSIIFVKVNSNKGVWAETIAHRNHGRKQKPLWQGN